MDNPKTSLIISEPLKLPPFALSQVSKAAKESALANAALIGKVTDRDSKIIAVRAQQELKAVVSSIEKIRVELKEPALIYGRKLDAFCAAEKLEAEKEFGRVSNAVKEFDDEERRRVQQEERLQREELERIEREKQAELKRIADEQAAREAEARRIQENADRKVREAADAAAKLAAEATTKKLRDAALKAQAEAQALAEKEARDREIRERVTNEQAQAAAAQATAVEEKAGDAAYVAARPIEITKVAGQRTTNDWEITRINDWTLVKARPDLVSRIVWDMRAIKDELRRNVKLPGVEARETFTPGVKLAPERKAIEV